MLNEANLDHSFLWKHVKAVRSEFRNKKNLQNVCKACSTCKAFLPDDKDAGFLREINFNNLKERLGVSSSTDEIKSLPSSTIEEGGKMFVYLNSCPPLHWQNFYHHLFFEKTNSEMILSVLNAVKNSPTKGSRAFANKVLVRLADIFGFQYNYFANETTWVNSIANVKGKKLDLRYYIVKLH